jgi:hypothetical protein
MNNRLTRRSFIRTAAASSAALTWLSARNGPNVFAADPAKAALLARKPPPPPPTGGTGIPFGLWDVQSGTFASMSPPFTASIPWIDQNVVIKELNAFRALGAQIFLNLIGSYRKVTNPDGTFSFALWKQNAIDRFKGIDFDTYLADGTVLGAVIIDDHFAPDVWSGHAIPNTMVEEMGAYVKSIWPMMPVAVRADPKNMQLPGGWKSVDIAWLQYNPRTKGPNYIQTQMIQYYPQIDLALVVGLQVLDGGLGESGVPGFSRGTYTMSYDEVMKYGQMLLGVAQACAFFSWTYPPSVSRKFSNWNDIYKGLVDLASSPLAKNHKRVPCVRPSKASSPSRFRGGPARCNLR